MGLHRGGLTLSRRGCRQIEAVIVTVLPKSALRKFHGFHGWVRLSSEDKTDPTPCTLHINLDIFGSKAHSGAPYRYTTQTCEYFRTAPQSFVIRRLSVWGEALSRRYNNCYSSNCSLNREYACREGHGRRAWQFAVLHLFPSRVLACQRSFWFCRPATESTWSVRVIHY